MAMLAGIRVLDLSLQLPGPFCTMMMADHGADVIKVDEPEPRVRNPFAGEEPGLSPADRYLNRGKRSLTLNLKSGEGREIFRKLAATADVVLEGFRPGVTARLGVDYATLSALNPRLVYCSISGYGQDGPMRSVAGHDINYISYAGVLGLCGPKDSPPTLPPVQIGDLFGGAMMALSGILMAPRQTIFRKRLDLSMTDGRWRFRSTRVVSCGRGPMREMILTMFPCYERTTAPTGTVSADPWRRGSGRILKALGREDLLVPSTEGDEAGRVRAGLGRFSRRAGQWVAFFRGDSPSPVLSPSPSSPIPTGPQDGDQVESPLGGTGIRLPSDRR
jgi:hypothetical protein